MFRGLLLQQATLRIHIHTIRSRGDAMFNIPPAAFSPSTHTLGPLGLRAKQTDDMRLQTNGAASQFSHAVR